MKKICLTMFLVFCTGILFAGLDEIISMDFRDTDVRDIVKLIAQKGGLGMVTEKSMRGNLTINIKDATVKEALDLVTNASGFSWILTGQTIFVTDPRKIENQMKIFSLSHYPVDEAAKILASTIKADIKIASDEHGNSLILNAAPATLEQAKKIIEEIDRPGRFYNGLLKVYRGDKLIHELTFKGQIGQVVNLVEHLKFDPVQVGEDRKHDSSKLGATIKTFSINEKNEISGEISADISSIERKTGNEMVQNCQVQFSLEAGKKIEVFHSKSKTPVRLMISAGF